MGTANICVMRPPAFVDISPLYPTRIPAEVEPTYITSCRLHDQEMQTALQVSDGLAFQKLHISLEL